MSRQASMLRKAQRGVILFVALIVLVAMSLTGIALMRSVDTNLLVAGNLAFRQGATAASDWGVESARAYLKNSLTGAPDALNADSPGLGYFSTWQQTVDPTNAAFDWSTKSVEVGTDSAGNTVRYVVHRMCGNPGAASTAATNCVKTSALGLAGAADTSTKGQPVYGVGGMALHGQTYYRVTVRILGPRNTLSYVQAILK